MHISKSIMQKALTFSLRARIMPLKVAATSVKFAIPPPIRSALFRPSGSAVTTYTRTKKRHKKEAKRNEAFLNYQQEKIMHTGFVPPV
jgi:hypothetical protein